MRCLVLGAGGFLGRHLCEALVQRGIPTRAFGRKILSERAAQGLEWHEGDFGNEALYPELVSGCGTVFHLIGATTPSTADKDRIGDLRSSVVPTLKFLDASVQNGVQRIVFVSSGGTVYGNPQSVPTPESAPTEPISSYGVTKLTIEKYLAVYHHLYGLEYRILRVANAYGPHQLGSKNQGVIGAYLQRIMAGQPVEIWGDGNVVRDYVYAKDVADALILGSSHAGPSRIFNIGTGVGHSLMEIVRAIEGQLGVAASIERKPGRPVDVLKNVLDIGLARHELKWVPKYSIPEGIRLTADWMKSRA
jgi:UDP-glucose 4-epimerase